MNGQVQIEPDARQRMVAVEHHMLRIDVGDDIQGLLRHVAAAASGQAMSIKNHALFQFLRKAAARLDKYLVLVVVAKCLFRLQMQVQGISAGMLQQGVHNALQQIFTTHKKFHGFFQRIEHFTLHVLEHPGQGDDAAGCDGGMGRKGHGQKRESCTTAIGGAAVLSVITLRPYCVGRWTTSGLFKFAQWARLYALPPAEC